MIRCVVKNEHSFHFKQPLLLLLYILSWVSGGATERKSNSSGVPLVVLPEDKKKRESTWNNNKRRKHGMKNELHLTHPMNVKGMKKRRKKDCSATISTRVFFFFNITPSFWLCFKFYKLCIYFIFTVSHSHIYIFYQLPISLSFKRRQVESVQFIF